MTGILLPKPEQLLDLVGHAVVIKQAMSGEFDKEIAALKEAKASLEEQNGIVKTIAQAKLIEEEANQYAEKIRGEVTDAIAKANQKLGEVLSREQAIIGREAAVANRESIVVSRTKALDDREQTMENAMNYRESTLLERENVLKQKEATYATSASKLASDIAAFNKRLESLKA